MFYMQNTFIGKQYFLLWSHVEFSMWELTLLGSKFAQQQEKFTHCKVDVD